jgi:hypothetical protein
MKCKLILVLAVTIMGCNQANTNIGSESEKESIKDQVRKTTDSMTKLASNMDLGVFDFFDTSSLFIIGGSVLTYEQRKKGFAEAIPNGKSQQFIKKFDNIRVLDKDHATWLFTGDVIGTLKNNSSDTTKNYCLTCLFKRYGSTWRGIQVHESAR